MPARAVLFGADFEAVTDAFSAMKGDWGRACGAVADARKNLARQAASI